MKDREDIFKPEARQILRSFGFTVIDIPRKDGVETPDFDVKGWGTRYVIELKVKDDDPDEVERDRQILLSNGSLVKSDSVGPRNTLAGIVSNAVSQMNSYDPSHSAFHVVWIHCSGDDPGHHYDRLHATLYGTKELVITDTDEDVYTKCYYFGESSFFTHRGSLDGALVTFVHKLQLFVNSLSEGKVRFRLSDLHSRLCDGLCDPDFPGEGEHILVADCDCNRKNAWEVISYLKRKYNITRLQMCDDPVQYSGKLLIKPDDANR